MKKTSVLLILILCSSILYLKGQNKGGLPYSFTHSVNAKVPVKQMPVVDNASLNTEEKLEDKRDAFTFGKEFQVDYNTLNSGLWEELPGGDRLWRLGIKSENAYSLNLTFDYFHLPEGGIFYIYTSDKSYILGGYTEKNNLPSGNFPTSLLPGGNIILEYFEPKSARNQGAIHLSCVIHGYKNFYFTKGFYGNSGFCNIDVNCNEGSNASDIKRSVCLILSGSKALCSGTLINNTKKDKTPYVLTAQHCLSYPASSFVFIFGYEADSCNGTSYSRGYSISGSNVVAQGDPSDFALLKLSSIPPPHYHVYYAGWNRLDSADGKVACIHHPSGDVKKISLCNQNVKSSMYEGYPDTHWKVDFWNKGTTEEGSSGSGLFNSENLLIGQLEGGTASCYNPDGYDLFGKFSYSWENKSETTASPKLKDYLDPLNTSVFKLEGMDTDSSEYDRDASLLCINSPVGNVCKMKIKPVFYWMNNGNDTIDEIKVLYTIDSSQKKELIINKKLAFGEIDSVTIDGIDDITEGKHRLKLKILLEGDENSVNDSISTVFNFNRGTSAHWNIKTDYYPSQTSWILKDENGKIIAKSEDSLKFMNVYKDTFCLSEGCYDFIIFDKAGNGLNGRDGYWQGYFYFYLQDKIIASGIQFGYKDSVHFCIDSNVFVSNPENNKNIFNFNVYPNPCVDEIQLRVTPATSCNYELEIYNIEGKKIMDLQNLEDGSRINVSNLPQGIYLVRLRDFSQSHTSKFVKIN